MRELEQRVGQCELEHRSGRDLVRKWQILCIVIRRRNRRLRQRRTYALRYAGA
nr:MAG TPA: hypothetical protein [Bacteriophage sp.]